MATCLLFHGWGYSLQRGKERQAVLSLVLSASQFMISLCRAGKSRVFTLISPVVVSTLKFLRLYSYFSAERRKPPETWKQKPFALDQMCAFVDYHATCRAHVTYPVCNDAVSLILKIE